MKNLLITFLCAVLLSACADLGTKPDSALGKASGAAYWLLDGKYEVPEIKQTKVKARAWNEIVGALVVTAGVVVALSSLPKFADTKPDHWNQVDVAPQLWIGGGLLCTGFLLASWGADPER